MRWLAGEPEPEADAQPAGHGAGAVAKLPGAHWQADGGAGQHPLMHAVYHARRRIWPLIRHQFPQGEALLVNSCFEQHSSQDQEQPRTNKFHTSLTSLAGFASRLLGDDKCGFQ